MFPKNIIEQALKIFVKENQIEVDDSALTSQVKKMRAKGKSTREIFQKYKNSIYTKEQVQKVVELVSEDKPEDDILKNEIDKLIRKKVETKKIIQRLLGKGFLYQEIKKYLENK
jgi:SOS response regulatory protein OraA/RecX